MEARVATRFRRRRAVVGASLVLAALAGLSLAALASGLGGQTAAKQSIVITAGNGTVTVTGAGSLVSGLTKVTLTNARRGPANLLLARLGPGRTLADVRAFSRRSAAIPDRLIKLPISEFGLPPGGSVVTTVDLPPGAYLASSPPDGRGLGQITEFAVGPGDAGGSPPATTGRVLMYDYGFRAPASIKGRGTLAIENAGLNLHFIVGIRLNPGTNATAVRNQLVNETLQGPPPGEFVSVIGLVGPGTTNYIETKLKPGTYLFVCFFADRHSAGHEHSEFGMVRKVVVR